MPSTKSDHQGEPKRLTFGSPKFSNEIYTEVAQSARLKDVRLLESSFRVQADLLHVFDHAAESYELGFSGKLSSFGYDAEDGFAVGSFEWKAEAKHGRKKAMTTKAKFMVIYGSLNHMDEEYVRLYYGKLSKFTSYPYFRGFLALNAAASAIVLPPLPSLTDRVD